MPNRADVDRAERDLLRRCGCLLGGSIGTFDDLFERIAARRSGRAAGRDRDSGTDRAHAVARRARGGDVARSLRPRFPGFADSLLAALSRARRRPRRPGGARGRARALYAAYRAELDRLGLWDRDAPAAPRCRARSRRDLDAWQGEPVFVYGFEDLTAAEWSLLEALAGAGRGRGLAPVRARAGSRSPRSRARPTTSRHSPTAGSRSCRRARRTFAAPALAHLERTLFEPGADAAAARRSRSLPRRRRRARHARARRRRGARRCFAAGRPPSRSALVVPSVERWRAPLETVFGTLRDPVRRRGACRGSAPTPLGQALLALLRFAWAGGRRAASSTRSCARPTPGLARTSVDYVEGRLRGPRRTRAPSASKRRPSASARRRSWRCASCGRAASPLEGVRDRARLDGARRLRARRAARRRLGRGSTCARSPPPTALLDELAAWEELGGPLGRRRADRGARPARGAARHRRRAGPGRRRSTAARAHAPLRQPCSSSGSRRDRSPAASAARRSSTTSSAARSAARLERPDPVSRDRYLFYTACTRATRRLYLVREAVTDDGSPREESPFWHDGRRALRPRGGRARDASAGALGAHVAARGRADRARAAARARAALGRPRRGRARARARRGERLDAAAARAPRRIRARAAAAEPGGARAARSADASSARPSSSASSTARRPGSSSAWSTRRRSTPRPTRCCAARSPTRRSTPSTRGCRRSSAPTASPPRTSSRRCVFLERCLDDALRGPASGSSSARSRRRSCARASGATSSGSSATRPSRRSVSCRGGSSSASAPTARPPSCSAGSSSATASS